MTALREIRCVYQKPDGRWVVQFSDRSRTNRARIAAAIKLGRPLSHTEVVHHLDGDKSNDALSNLDVIDSQATHASLHADAIRAYWSRPRSCPGCGSAVESRTPNCTVCANRHRRWELAGRTFVPPRRQCARCGVDFNESAPDCSACAQRHYLRGKRAA